MEIQIRPYTEKDLPDMIGIWNEVVEEGIAFPQENLLNLETGRRFFAEQTYNAVAATPLPVKSMASTFSTRTTSAAADISVMPAMPFVPTAADGILAKNWSPTACAKANGMDFKSCSSTPWSPRISMPGIYTNASDSFRLASFQKAFG